MSIQKNVLTQCKLLLALFLMLVCGLGAVPVHAASGGLTISPTSIDKEIAPGSSYNDQILVINQGELDISYHVYATPYSVSGEEYKPYFSPIKGATDITKWFTFKNTGGVLKIGAQDTIPFTVSVPKGTNPGSYYATVFAETEDKGISGVVTRKRVGTVLYIRVAGNAVERGNIDTWSVPWLQRSPFTATVKIANSGSVHFQSDVKVTVSDLFGGPKFTFTRQPKILPQKLRDIPVAWENGSTFGLFKVGGTVTYLGKTEPLPTKYVFIASTGMRILTVGLLFSFTAVMIFVGRKRVASKK